MGPLLAGLIALGLLLLLAGGYIPINPGNLAQGMRRSGGLLVAVAAIALALTGRVALALLLGGGAWVLLFGTVPPWNRPDYGLGTGQPSDGQRTAGPPATGKMSRAEALKVLGLEQ